jgi:hypothetical protein
MVMKKHMVPYSVEYAGEVTIEKYIDESHTINAHKTAGSMYRRLRRAKKQITRVVNLNKGYLGNIMCNGISVCMCGSYLPIAM